MVNILDFAIGTVAGGDVRSGLGFAASVFFREQTQNAFGGVDSNYDIKAFADRVGSFGTNSGFKSKFKDQTGNQVEHFINEAYGISTLSYNYAGEPDVFGGQIIGNLAAIGFEVLPLLKKDGTNPDFIPDMLLGFVATDYVGALVADNAALASYHLGRLQYVAPEYPNDPPGARPPTPPASVP
jgi:hypothetical protein